MSDLRLQLPRPRSALRPKGRGNLGAYLVQQGALTQAQLNDALLLASQSDAPMSDILLGQGTVSRTNLLTALSQIYALQLVDLDVDPPATELAQRLDAKICLRHRVIPWLEIGDTLLVATQRPEQFRQMQRALGPDAPQMLAVIADDRQIMQHIGRLYGGALATRAATRVPDSESCRRWETSSLLRRISGIFALLLLAGLCLIYPLPALTCATLFAFSTLVMATTLKAMAFAAHFRPRAQAPPFDGTPSKLPVVSIMVPLLREDKIANELITRLSRLTYPKALLDVVLVLEADDKTTSAALARTKLPNWINVVVVPNAGALRTKPRALNYALDFCRGSIIGVWDAEDAPEEDQIEKVAQRFDQAPSNVACLQGVLDYYNPRSNWLARCFTIEYATWWRLILPGVARLGLVLPLGGTTLFFRRSILERLNGWDAHNVTEDADLGVRLARHGYATELIATTTYEEANCRTWPWVRQRSRWLKGFLITYCVHMRRPLRLLRQLGVRRFLGIQAMFLATFSQFALAPLLWSFWLTLAGVTHPVAQAVGPIMMLAMVTMFILTETLNLATAMVAVSGPRHRHLLRWVFTLPFYFPLGTLAAMKALYEFVLAPFHWDKTQHGVQQTPPDL